MRCHLCTALTLTAVLWVPLLILGYWWFFDYASWNPLGGIPMKYDEQYAVTSEVHPGQELISQWNYEIFRDDCVRTVELFLVNGRDQRIHTHQGISQGEGNGRRELTAYVKVPENTPLGIYRLKSTSHWHCNPLRAYTTSAELFINVVR